MNLLHPWFLALGVATISLPIAIHYLTKPRPKKLPLSTVRFVKQAVKQKRARYRLRDLLVLLLRSAAVALLGWAFARPLLDAKPLISTTASTDSVRIVLLDSSLSMAAVSGGQSAFDRARSAAARYLQYQPGVRADLLLAAARPNAVFQAASNNHAALVSAVTSAAPLPQALDVQSAINRAAEIFAKTPHEPTAPLELIVLSDFQRTSWSRVDFSPLPKDVVIQFESVAPKRVPGNIAVLNVAPVGRVEQGREVRLDVEIGNYSSGPKQAVVEITAGEAVCHLSGLCLPNVKTTLSSTIQPQTTGWLGGTAKIIDAADALAEDDSRAFVLNVRPPPTFALITRESGTPHASSSHFLERALVPILAHPGQIGERVVRLDAAAPEPTLLQNASLLVLDHPGRLSPDTIKTLATMVRAGRGLLYVAAETADAANLKLFSDAAGTDLKMPVEFQPAAANAARLDLFLLEWNKDQPPFKAMAETMASAAGFLRFSGGLSSRQLDGGLQDDVLARFSDRSAALVVTSCGAGSIAVLNADLVDCNLPSSPVFVPMIGELCSRLLSNSRAIVPTSSGEPFAASLPSQITAAKDLSVVDSKGKKVEEAVLADETNGVIWRQPAAGAPGVYRVMRGSQIVYSAAMVVPASESDLEPLDPQILKSRLAAGRNVYFQSAGDEPPKDRAWAWILVACVTCLLGELGVLKTFKA